MALPETVEDRLIRLECLSLEIQRDLEVLNSVVLEHRQLIERVSQLVERMESRLGRLGGDDEVRDPVYERPPHY